MEYKTTKAHFKIFKSECEYWITRLGMLEWEIGINHHEEVDGSQASCTVNLDARAAYLNLEPVWYNEVPDEMAIRLAAFHEVMELFTSPVWLLAERRYITPQQLEASRHGIIRTLENAWWREDIKKRKK